MPKPITDEIISPALNIALAEKALHHALKDETPHGVSDLATQIALANAAIAIAKILHNQWVGGETR